MPFQTKRMQQADVQLMLEEQYETLSTLLNDGIAFDIQYHEDALGQEVINPLHISSEQTRQDHQDTLDHLRQQQSLLAHRLERCQQMIKQDSLPCFYLDPNSTKAELAKLIVIIDKQLNISTIHASQRLFLTEVREAAESLKEVASQDNATRHEVFILLPKNEQKYSEALVEAMTYQKLDALIDNLKQDESAKESYQWAQKIKHIYHIMMDRTKISGFTHDELDFLKQVQTGLEDLIHRQSESNLSGLKAQTQVFIENLTLDLKLTLSYHFKQFINHLFKTIELKPPFVATEAISLTTELCRKLKDDFQHQVPEHHHECEDLDKKNTPSSGAPGA